MTRLSIGGAIVPLLAALAGCITTRYHVGDGPGEVNYAVLTARSRGHDVEIRRTGGSTFAGQQLTLNADSAMLLRDHVTVPTREIESIRLRSGYSGIGALLGGGALGGAGAALVVSCQEPACKRTLIGASAAGGALLGFLIGARAGGELYLFPGRK